MNRFQKIYQQGTIDVIEIWLDTETGVQYLFHKNGNAGGFTPLLDREGKPVVCFSPRGRSSASRVSASILGRGERIKNDSIFRAGGLGFSRPFLYNKGRNTGRGSGPGSKHPLYTERKFGYESACYLCHCRFR